MGGGYPPHSTHGRYGPMPPIRPIERIAQKWQAVTPQRVEQYTQGVAEPLRDWQREALAAHARYVAAMREVLEQARQQAGVRGTSTSFWQSQTQTKGKTRWPEGVRLGLQRYAERFAPYREVIARTSLPERGPVGSAQNLERVRAIITALHEAKLARLRGGGAGA